MSLVLYQEILAGTRKNVKRAEHIWKDSGLFMEMDYWVIDDVTNTKAGHFQAWHWKGYKQADIEAYWNIVTKSKIQIGWNEHGDPVYKKKVIDPD